MTTKSEAKPVDETPRYQVTRMRIIDGKKYKSGATVTAAEIPDHEWGRHAKSGDFWPALPRTKPKAEVAVQEPEEEEELEFNPRIADEPMDDEDDE